MALSLVRLIGAVPAADLCPKYSAEMDLVRAIRRRWPDCHVVWNPRCRNQWGEVRGRWQVWRESETSGGWYCAFTVEDESSEYRPLDRRVLWDLIDRDLWDRYGGRDARAMRRAAADVEDRTRAAETQKERAAEERLYDVTLEHEKEVGRALEEQARRQGFSP